MARRQQAHEDLREMGRPHLGCPTWASKLLKGHDRLTKKQRTVLNQKELSFRLYQGWMGLESPMFMNTACGLIHELADLIQVWSLLIHLVVKSCYSLNALPASCVSSSTASSLDTPSLFDWSSSLTLKRAMRTFYILTSTSEVSKPLRSFCSKSYWWQN